MLFKNMFRIKMYINEHNGSWCNFSVVGFNTPWYKYSIVGSDTLDVNILLLLVMPLGVNIGSCW